jgi:hypothetical protein
MLRKNVKQHMEGDLQMPQSEILRYTAPEKNICRFTENIHLKLTSPLTESADKREANDVKNMRGKSEYSSCPMSHAHQCEYVTPISG